MSTMSFHCGYFTLQVFHEGLKSWSCCKETNKPVLEFDEFVKIAVSVGGTTELDIGSRAEI